MLEACNAVERPKSMEPRHIEEVKKSLGDSTLELLKTIFQESQGTPPAVPAKRFRAKHRQWMDQLNNMGSSSFLVNCDYTADTYRVSAYVLPLIQSKHSSEILTCMERIYAYLRHYYDEHLDQPIKAGDLFKAVQVEHPLMLETLFYMRDVGGWWSGLGNDFPLKEDATVRVNEKVLNYESFGALIEQVYEWNFVNPSRYSGGTTWINAMEPHSTDEPAEHVGTESISQLTFEDLLHPVIRNCAFQL